MKSILVLYNAPVLPVEHPDYAGERDVVDTADAVASALSRSGFSIEKLGINNDPSPLIQKLQNQKQDLVFNLFEGTGDRPELESYVTGLIDWWKVPFTGCPPLAQVLARDKVRTKQLLRGAGLPTADFLSCESLKFTKFPDRYPVFVKPGGTDGSQGITLQSVVQNELELREQVARLLNEYGPPVLIEEYLPGPEYNVGIVEVPHRLVLPIAEMVYTPQPGVSWPVVTSASKWNPGSAEDLAMLPRVPAMIQVTLAEQLKSISLSAFELLGCRGYARMDIRLNFEGHPCILEVNPNPDIGPTAGLSKMLKAVGWDYDRFIVQLATAAMEGF